MICITGFKVFTLEGVKNIPASVSEYMRLKKIDDLEKYIASAKKQKLFDEVDRGFYTHLDSLGSGLITSS
jgi:hypothetical protein